MFDMFPPSSGLLDQCPQFESLYKKLTHSLLDQDGTIKSELVSSSKIQSDLRGAREELLRETLLSQSLQGLVSSEQLPREMVLMEMFLDSEDKCGLDGGDGGLVGQRRLGRTEQKLIEASLRHELSQQLKSLRSLIDDGNKICRQREQAIHKAQDNLTQSHISLVTTTKQILETANAVIKLLRTNLDMNRHGQSERTIKLFTEYLVAVSQALQAKLEATSDDLQTSLYTTEVLAILQRIRTETQSIQANLSARGEYLETSLERYGSAGPEYERIVKEYLRTHVSILRCEEEIEELKDAKNARRY